MLESVDGVQVLRLKAPRTKDISYLRRTLAEFAMPLAMLRHFRQSPLANERWEGIIWYSPSIFLGPLASALKRSNDCKGYLIIRDIFPEWAVDMGLITKGIPYFFFRAVARYQYSVADIIGVQSPGNQPYFHFWCGRPGRKLEVLQNWLSKPAQARSSIRINASPLSGRKVLVYAGNMGVAQGLDILLDLAEKLSCRTDLGFLFVGRGGEAARLKAAAQARKLDNVVFHDEIDPDEIPDLYAQCCAGIVALDPRHKSHNIPGKFLTYIQCGLPVLANVNAGNDLARLIREAEVGQVCETNEINDLAGLTINLLSQIESDKGIHIRCRNLFQQQFAVENAVKQIVAALSSQSRAR